MKFHLQELAKPDAATLERIGKLRVLAWTTEVPAIAELGSWLDEYDHIALHWVILHDGVIVAAARLTTCDNLNDAPDAGDFDGLTYVPQSPIGILSKLVVAPQFRRLGFSKRLVAARIDAAERLGCRSVFAATSSGVHRVTLLRSFGFDIVGARQRNPLTSLGLLPRPGVVLMRRVPRTQSVSGIDGSPQ